MAGDAYKRYVTGSLLPGFLQGPYGITFMSALGDGLDQLVYRSRVAVKSRLPGLAPYDAVPAIGEERGIDRGPSETTPAYRLRLKRAWDLWVYAGTAFGLLTAIKSAGFGVAKIRIPHSFEYTLDSDDQLVVTPRASWTPSGPYMWSKFGISFYPPFAALVDPPPADNTPTADLLRRIVLRWKPAHATCTSMVFVISGHLWGETGLKWGAPGLKWGADTVRWTPPS